MRRAEDDAPLCDLKNLPRSSESRMTLWTAVSKQMINAWTLDVAVIIKHVRC